MSYSRAKRAGLNVVFSLLAQGVALVCGLIVPRLMITRFGSEAYGATASIAQFLAYIALLEAGIGGVARAALYKPLAEGDNEKISAVVSEIKRFFRVIGLVFLIYVAVLAAAFQRISHIQCFDWATTALLVVVISISTFSQYYIGISYAVLLQAAQRTYITKIINMIANTVNTIAIVCLVFLKCNLITVKLISSLVFALKPVCMWIYVKKNFTILPVKEKNSRYLEQKWSGLSQHLAYFLHSNTDVALLTIFANLSTVAVYSVYNMIISEIKNLTASFSTGMESVFGDMLAKKEHEQLMKTFSYYETLLSFISLILFSVTSVMILPFVVLYTKDVTDVNYIQPIFALLLIVACMLYCLRLPYNAVIIAAGHFRQTRKAAYGEAIINILTSIILVMKLGLIGVAIGTVCAVFFRFVYYAFYLSRNIIYRDSRLFLKRLAINASAFVLISLIGKAVISHAVIRSYATWVMYSCLITAISVSVTAAVTCLFYRKDLTFVLKKLRRKAKKKN